MAYPLGSHKLCTIISNLHAWYPHPFASFFFHLVLCFCDFTYLFLLQIVIGCLQQTRQLLGYWGSRIEKKGTNIKPLFPRDEYADLYEMLHI